MEPLAGRMAALPGVVEIYREEIAPSDKHSHSITQESGQMPALLAGGTPALPGVFYAIEAKMEEISR
jgi:hypothetical protein